jgi:hypothetical protein
MTASFFFPSWSDTSSRPVFLKSSEHCFENPSKILQLPLLLRVSRYQRRPLDRLWFVADFLAGFFYPRIVDAIR